jgi:serine/threonine protein kinase
VEPTIPIRLGRYEVLSLLGRGGMGAVYKARDPAIDRVVALKTVGAHLLATAESDEYRERFRREASAAGRLSHPNIVSVYDLGHDDATGTPFIVMEYVEGTSLSTLLAENPKLPLGQALDITEQVASALAEAHRYGIIHRDIKPANVFVDTRGRVKVGDFGIARLEGSELTQTGVSLGTPGYLAPEVVRGANASTRSDIFALGVLAYQLVTSRRAFAGSTREALAIEVLERVPDPPRTVRPDVPEHVSAAIMKALDKSPSSRTPSAEAFLRELRDTGRILQTRVARSVPPPTRGGRRRFVLGGLAAVVVVLGPYLTLRACRAREASLPGGTDTPPRAPSPTLKSPARRETYRPVQGGRELNEQEREERKRLDEQAREERKRAEEHAREEAKRREEREREERKRREEHERERHD